ncbi:MAG: serpin family protein [Thermoplasmatota archaeon]
MFVVVIVAIGLVFGGLAHQDMLFSRPAEAQKTAIDTHATEDSVADLVESLNAFSLDMYAKLCSGNHSNVFFSPYSIFVALAMTYEGARGETAQEMHTVLRFRQNNHTTLCSFGKIYNLLNVDTEYTLHTANALWTQEKYPFLEEYLHFIENYYMGDATDVNFTYAEQAAQMISQWVEENTGGKIKDFITGDDIHPLTRLILTNAIYFKGNWRYQFPPENTENKAFEVSPDTTVDVPTMSMSHSGVKLQYAETDDMQILKLPYISDQLTMTIFLPRENNVSKIEHMMTPDNLTQWQESLIETQVDMSLPKFSLETEYRLKQVLMDMGMAIPFTLDADFSGMNGNQDLYIDKVIHKAFIEVNEKGTEAAGATSVHMSLTSVPDNVVFNANHPFLFIIQHQETDTILFMGKICNPQ